MSSTARDLVGGWQLESWSYVYSDGRPDEHPLGVDAQGLILYTPTGQVSATIMRADRSECFAYAGRYEVKDGSVFHSVEVSTNASLVGITSTRHIALEGNCLTLSGPDFFAGSGRSQRIAWSRIAR